ncbi:heterokaryon incompatibility protein-domain-containing protein [Echria macrotheca]|uniref:Heterokaryon incompatibility protein-domain-containing protein n=1 Tax=Echria macrotheca TaxID=438768 RepID=A0AAJ0F958_9PEZI|nr:heterokaryon incompatibility protein-domain-containing protein [Echria macrotheca]
MTAPYVYTPLLTDPLEIRLLEFISSAGDAEIRLKVHTVQLQHAKFVALSYVWGHHPHTYEDVTVDGCRFRITESLASALRAAQRHGLSAFPHRPPQDFRLWADAICIDQQNVEECNHHVPQMKYIYEAAELAIGYAGRDTEPLRLAMTTLDIIGAELRAHPAGIATWGNSNAGIDPASFLAWMEKYPALYTKEYAETDPNVSLVNPTWAAIHHLLNLPLWERAWIFQEIVLSPTMLVVSDTASVRLPHLEAFTLWVCRLNYSDYFARRPSFLHPAVLDLLTSSKITTQAMDRVLAACRAKRMKATSTDSIDGWINSFSGSHLRASNPRDLIYGLLGVSRISAIKVDYSAPLSRVFTDYAAAWTKGFRGAGLRELGFLTFAGQGLVSRYGDAQFPSFAPHYPFLSENHPVFMIGHAPSALVEFPPDTEGGRIENSSLFASGVQVDTVVSVFENWSDQDSFLDTILDLVSRRPVYPTGAPTINAVLHALSVKLAGPRELKNHVLNLHYAWALVALLVRGIGSYRRPRDEYQGILDRLGLDTSSGMAFAHSLRTTFGLDQVPDEELHAGWLGLLMQDGGSELAGLEDYGELATRYMALKTHLDVILPQTFFETAKGYIGVIPAWAGILEGDVLCVLSQSNSPVMLRKNRDFFAHIATCHVWGLFCLVPAESFGRIETLEVR